MNRFLLFFAALFLALPGAAQEREKEKERDAPAKPVAGPVELAAGPVRLKFEDGELRYFRCRGREIIRRLYFAVRDDKWDTILPAFTKMTLRRPGAGEFTLELEARCRRAPDIDFRWSGKIEGKDSGTVTFTVTAEAAQAMRSNRIGICVLYPTPEVLGQPFTTRDAAGEKTRKAFPTEVAAPLVVAPDFTELHYITREGQRILAHFTGSTVSMEDQRNFGDTSFKAYAPLPFDYPQIPAGKALTQSVSLMTGPFLDSPQAPVRRTELTLGPVVPDAAVPTLTAPVKGDAFFDLNNDREKRLGDAALAFEFRPSLHLFDDDTYWENIPAVADMARSLRRIAPGAAIDVGPIRLDPPYARAGRDPRNARPFGAAWAALTVKHLALGQVRAAAFDLGPGHAQRLLALLSAAAGKPVRDVRVVSPALVPPVDGYGMGIDIVVVNKTGRLQSVRVNGLAKGPYSALSFHGRSAPSSLPRPRRIAASGGGTTLSLAPHEVCVLTPLLRR